MGIRDETNKKILFIPGKRTKRIRGTTFIYKRHTSGVCTLKKLTDSLRFLLLKFKETASGATFWVQLPGNLSPNGSLSLRIVPHTLPLHGI